MFNVYLGTLYYIIAFSNTYDNICMDYSNEIICIRVLYIRNKRNNKEESAVKKKFKSVRPHNTEKSAKKNKSKIILANSNNHGLNSHL